MARSKQVVATLAEAIAQAEHYPDAQGFMIAPLMQKGGARSWHVIDWDKGEWVRDDDDQDVPGVDSDPELLPKLPKSRIGMWAFTFTDERGELLKPEIQIALPRPAESSASDRPAEAAPRVGASSPRNEAIAVLTDSLRQSNEDARAAMEQAIRALSLAREEIEKTAAARRAELEVLAKMKQTEIETLHRQLAQAITDRDVALRENGELCVAMSEVRNRNDLADILREIFAGKPELLVSSAKELFGGMMKVAKQLEE